MGSFQNEFRHARHFAAGVLSQVRPQEQRPFIPIAGSNRIQRTVGPEKLQQVMAGSAVDLFGCRLHIMPSCDPTIDERSQLGSIWLRFSLLDLDQPQCGQTVLDVFTEPHSPLGGLGANGGVVLHRRIQVFQVQRKASCVVVVGVLQPNALSISGPVFEPNPNTFGITRNGCHIIYPLLEALCCLCERRSSKSRFFESN